MLSRLFIITAVILAIPTAVSAQSFDSLIGGAATSFSMSANPQYPVPYSTVALSFLSNSIDLANATLIVLSNGKKIYQGSVRPVGVPLGKAGSVVEIEAKISSNGATYAQTLSVQPQDVALVAEPISSAPPLYNGKSLVPLEGDVRVVAVASLRNANGKILDSSALSYSWTVDGMQIANSSGIGKTSIIVASPLQYRERSVSVAAMSSDGKLVGGSSLSLMSSEPSVRIYENDPLLGIRFDRALSNVYTISRAESTLYAAPFSMPTTQVAPLIRWFLNGSVAQTGNSITLRPSGSGQGRASISLVASSGNYITATAGLSLSFGAKSSTNFFGL